MLSLLHLKEIKIFYKPLVNLMVMHSLHIHFIQIPVKTLQFLKVQSINMKQVILNHQEQILQKRHMVDLQADAKADMMIASHM